MPDSSSSPTSSELSPDLFEQYFVIRPNNPWREVQETRKRLQQVNQEQPTPAPSNPDLPNPESAQHEPIKQEQPYRIEEMEADRDKLVSYANILRRSGRVIGYAICLAAHLRRFSSSKRFADGLQALSTGLDLQSLDESTKVNELERCLRELVSIDNLPSLEFPPTGDAATWRTALEQWLAAVNDLSFPEVRDVRRDAWSAWDSRLHAFVQQRPEETPDINYLRSRAEGSAPGTILSARLGRVTLPQMTDALTTALMTNTEDSRDCPKAFGFALLEALGFDLSNDLADSDDSVKSFLQSRNVPATSSPTTKGILIVRTSAGSRTGQWGIVRTMPTLDTTVENYTHLFTGKKPLDRYLAPRLTGILFEVDRTENLRDANRRVLAEAAKLRRALLDPPSIRTGLLLSRPVSDATAFDSELRKTMAVAPQDAAEASRMAFGA